MKDNKYPLFFVSDQLSCRSDIFKILSENSKEYLTVNNGDTFCNYPLDVKYFREEFLQLCHGLSLQTGKAVAVNAGVYPDFIEGLDNTGLFSNIYYIELYSSDEALEIRDTDEFKKRLERVRSLVV